jgi:CheY-like chemotaxis protein
MSGKRILIVDDDKTILHMLKKSLSSLGPVYQIDTTIDSTEALEQVRNQSFDLVVADYMMPGITGIDLARAIRKISPDTRIVLMTAFGTAPLKDTTKYIGVDGYIDKPFTFEEICEVIENTVQLASQEKDLPGADDGSTFNQSLRGHLQGLQVNTSARCVLLLNSQGDPVQVVGRTDDLEIASIGKFVAANFQAARELAERLGRQSTFKSNYHEGDKHNIYAYDINGKFLLAVLFGAQHKPGVVWFYTRQAATELAQVLSQSTSV